MNKKIDDLRELLATTKLNELLHKKEDPIEEKKHTVVFVLAIVGAVAAIAAIAYAVYKLVTPDYLEDFEDDFDDEFEDDFDSNEDNKEETETAEPVEE